MLKRAAGAIAAAMIAGACILPSSAWAASYPTVDDVNEWGAHKSCLTVTATGGASLKLKATSEGERLKVRKHRHGVWTVIVRNGAKVRLTASDSSGKRTVTVKIGRS